MRILGASRQVFYRRPRLPLRHGFLVDAVALGENPHAFLTMLYRAPTGHPLSFWRYRVETVLPFIPD